MRDFFKSWRRKSGLAILVLALAIVAVWIRSGSIADEMRFNLGDRAQLIVSQDDRLTWWGWSDESSLSRPFLNSEPVWTIPHNLHRDPQENRPQKRRFPFDLRQVMLASASERNVIHWSFPHGVIVALLTLLSGCLLLSTPRRAKQPTPPPEPDYA